MKYSLSLGKIAGIKIFVHWTFSILIGWIIFSNLQACHSATQVFWSVLFVLSIFLCVTLHELGHALAARRYHIETLDITLLPIGGLARLKSIPEKPSEELVVAAAGPLMNILIFLALIPFTYSYFETFDPRSLGIVDANSFLPTLAVINLWLAVFNLIPAFPMDGGRILRSLLSFKLPRQKATQIAARIGQVLAIGFVFLGFFGNPFLIFIGLFIFLGAQAEATFVHTKSFLKDFYAHDVLMKEYKTIESNEPVRTAVAMLLNGQCKTFLVTDNEIPVGVLTREHIIQLLSESGADALVQNRMDTTLPKIDSLTPLDQLYQRMIEDKAQLALITQHGNFVGVVDMENIAEFVMIRNAQIKA